MTTPDIKILVAGAGIAGSCLAFWLSKSGLKASITIIERAPKPRTTGQAVDIRGPAVDIIRQMGLEEIIRESHTTETGTAFLNSKGEIIAQFDATGDSKNQSATSEYEILRGRLAEIFLDATSKLGDVKYVFGESIATLVQDEDGVHVTSTGETVNGTYDIVVGCDGLASKTRSVLFDESTIGDPYTFLGSYAAFFTIPSRPDDRKLWFIYSADKGRCVSLRPHKNPATMGAYLTVTTPSWTAKDSTIEEAMSESPAAVRKVLRQYFEDLGWQTGRILDGMDAADDFYFSQIAQTKLPTWTNGHCTLAGDASYCPTPISGVGTSLAIEGAYVLAGELSKVTQRSDIPAALAKYEEVFRPVVEKAQKLPPGAPQIVNPQTGWGLSIRNTLIWGVSRSKVYKLFGGQNGPSYKLPEYNWVDI
jgi:2-polyprenyl-6-methoxyphenol hydroxylase-like FAD-dependent oxidoreductase